MRRVDNELAPQTLLLLQALRHPVEVISERDHLVRSLPRHLNHEVALRHPPGGSANLFQRAGELAREQDREQNAREGCDCGGAEEDERHRLVEHFPGERDRGAVLHHEPFEDVLADTQDARGDDHDGEAGDQQRGERDTGRDSPEQETAAHASCPVSVRYPAPRTVAT